MQAPGHQLLAAPQCLGDPQRLVHGAHRALQGKGIGPDDLSGSLPPLQFCDSVKGTVLVAVSPLPGSPWPSPPTLAVLQSATTSTLGTNFGKSSAAGEMESSQPGGFRGDRQGRLLPALQAPELLRVSGTGAAAMLEAAGGTHGLCISLPPPLLAARRSSAGSAGCAARFCRSCGPAGWDPARRGDLHKNILDGGELCSFV